MSTIIQDFDLHGELANDSTHRGSVASFGFPASLQNLEDVTRAVGRLFESDAVRPALLVRLHMELQQRNIYCSESVRT
jgi:hypothetical protein